MRSASHIVGLYWCATWTHFEYFSSSDIQSRGLLPFDIWHTRAHSTSTHQGKVWIKSADTVDRHLTALSRLQGSSSFLPLALPSRFLELGTPVPVLVTHFQPHFHCRRWHFNRTRSTLKACLKMGYKIPTYLACFKTNLQALVHQSPEVWTQFKLGNTFDCQSLTQKTS